MYCRWANVVNPFHMFLVMFPSGVIDGRTWAKPGDIHDFVFVFGRLPILAFFFSSGWLSNPLFMPQMSIYTGTAPRTIALKVWIYFFQILNRPRACYQHVSSLLSPISHSHCTQVASAINYLFMEDRGGRQIRQTRRIAVETMQWEREWTYWERITKYFALVRQK